MIDQDFCGVVECIIVDFMFLDVNVNVNNIICLGDNNGQIIVILIGGIFFFFYFWNIGVIIVFISGFVFGIYIVILIDSEGCQVVGLGIVIELFVLFVNVIG